MPREYTQSGGQPSPNPSQFGSAEIRLDNPQFVAQTAVDVGVNPFEQLQGILKSAVGASASYLQNKTNIVEGQMAVEQAKYVRNQRAIADQDRLAGDVREGIQRDIVRKQTQMHKFYASEMFDEADATLTQIEEQATDDTTKSWAAQERLQMQSAKAAALARASGTSPVDRALTAALHKQVTERFNRMRISEDEAERTGQPSAFINLSGDALLGAIRDSIMLSETNSPGFVGPDSVGLTGWYLLPQESRDQIEASIVNQAGSLALDVNASRQEKRVRQENQAREDTAENIGASLVSGDTQLWEASIASYGEAESENKLSEQDKQRLTLKSFRAFGTHYMRDDGMVGAMAAASEIEARLKNGTITIEQANATVSGIQGRIKAAFEKATSAVQGRAQAVDPEDPNSLVHLPGYVVPEVLKELGVTKEDAVKFGLGEELGRLENKQAQEYRNVEQIAEQDASAARRVTILGFEIKADKVAADFVIGSPEYINALTELGEAAIVWKNDPLVLASITRAELRLKRDNRTYLATEARTIRENMDRASAGQEMLIKEGVYEAREDDRIQVDQAKTLVNDTFTAAALEVNPDKRKALFREALGVIKGQRLDLQTTEYVHRQLSAAELSLTRGLTGGGADLDKKTTYGTTHANEIWAATDRSAKKVPVEQQTAIYAQGYDTMIAMGTFNPASAKHLEALVTQGGNDTRLVMDVLKRSGALTGATGVSDIMWKNAPIAMKAALLSQADALAKAMRNQSPEQDAAALDAHVETAQNLTKGQKSAFTSNAKGGDDATSIDPLTFKKQINAALSEVYDLTGDNLTIHSFNSDDRQVFDLLFNESLNSNTGGDPVKAIAYATSGMRSLGYSAVKMDNKIDFVYDPYGVVPQDLSDTSKSWFGESGGSEGAQLARQVGLQAIKELVPELANLTADQSKHLIIEFVNDDHYIRQKGGGVPFNVILPGKGGRVISYTDFPRDQVPVISRQDIIDAGVIRQKQMKEFNANQRSSNSKL
jgi:hypothetical protein